MKNIYLPHASLGLVLLVAGCGGGSESDPVTPIPTAAVKITPANATTVAQGTMAPSKSLAKSGSGMAGTVGVVTQSSTRTRSVLDMSLARFAQARSVHLDPATGVTGAIANFPVTLGCAVSGVLTLNVQDTNNNTVIDSGDVLTMTLFGCNDGVSTDNGSLAFSITTISGGAVGGEGAPGAPLIATFTLSFNNFSSRDNATSLTDSINGNISFSTSDDGTNTTGTMSGTSLSMTNSVGGAFLLTNYAISFTQANVPTSLTPYSFTFDMTIASVAANGSVTIVTTTPFTGLGTGEATAGEMVITGADNSTLTLTAQGDGTNIGMVVDEDGAAGPIAPVTLPDLTWASI